VSIHDLKQRVIALEENSNNKYVVKTLVKEKDM